MAINKQEFDSLMEQASAFLPYWARNTNPIVRRHLGLGGHTVPPALRPLLIGLAVWGVIFVAGLFVPGIVHVTLLLFLASIMLVPITMLLYAHILFTVARTAAHNMQDEMKNNTFNLLRATPMSLDQIFLGKVAAAMWKRSDDLVLVAQVIVVFAPPILYAMYSPLWPPEETPIMTLVVMLLAMIVSLLRVVLEPIMIGTLGVLVGLVAPNRSTAITATIALGAFYVLLLNLTRQLPDVAGSREWLFVMDFIVPIVLPVLLSTIFLRVAHRIVQGR